MSQHSSINDNKISTVRKTKKEKCREKEYRRSQNINCAFESLQQCIPYLKPEERKRLPKIKTLRLAAQYINHLSQLLDGNQMYHSYCDTEVRPLEHSDFRSKVTSEMRIRNNYRERAHATEMDSATVQRIRERDEQRTRWFQVDKQDKPNIAPQPFDLHSTNMYNQVPTQYPSPVNHQDCRVPIDGCQTSENTYYFY